MARIRTPGAAIDFKAVKTRAQGSAVTPPDVVVGFSEFAANKFLAAHFVNNSNFYDRSREKQPNSPLYVFDFNDHGTKVQVKLWAKVEKSGGTPAVAIKFKQSPASASRFAAWWKVQYGDAAPMDALPPNLELSVAKVTLQVNFPKLDGSASENQAGSSVCRRRADICAPR